MLRITQRRGIETDQDLGFLQGFFIAYFATGKPRSIGAWWRFFGNVGKSRLRQRDDLVVINMTGRGQHHVRRAIMVVQKALQGLAIERTDRLNCAQDRSADRLIAIGRRLEIIEDLVLRRIERGADFLHDHMPFAFQLLRIEHRMGEDIAQNIDAERRIVL